MISSALAGSKRGSSVSVPPIDSAAFIAHVWPKLWNSGSAPSVTANESRPIMSTFTSDVAAQVSVRELGALGRAGGARGVEDHGGVDLVAVDDAGDRLVSSSSASNAPDSTVIAASGASPATSCHANDGRRAAVGYGSKSTSRLLSSGFIGTTIAPARRMP